MITFWENNLTWMDRINRIKAKGFILNIL